MNTRVALDVIDVRTPCPADWEKMAGDDRTRFCQGCQKHVYNLSAMAADEAERIVCQNAGRLCVRFERDPAGRVVTLDYRGSSRRGRTWKAWTLIALAGAIITGSVQAVFFGMKIQPPGNVIMMGTPPPPPGGGFPALMGEVAAPEPPPAQPSGPVQ